MSKCFITDVSHTPEIGHALDAWIWSGISIPLHLDGEFDHQLIGHAQALRWWRRSIRNSIGTVTEKCELCFMVKHALNPVKRVGDFSGTTHGISLEVVGDRVLCAAIVKIP